MTVYDHGGERYGQKFRRSGYYTPTGGWFQWRAGAGLPCALGLGRRIFGMEGGL